jgi:hypothetical protein
LAFATTVEYVVEEEEDTEDSGVADVFTVGEREIAC